MNKLVKILSILVVTGMSLIFITSCKDDEKDPINPGSGDFVINGKVITEKTINADNTLQAREDEETVNEETVNKEVVGESKVENKSFSIKLRAPQNLLPYSGFEDIPSGITVSNPNARVVISFLRLNNAGTSPIGKDFLICAQSLPEVEVGQDIDLMKEAILCVYVYASEAVKIKGDIEEEGDSFLYDLDLKKGWNIALMQKASDDNEGSVFKTINSVPSGYNWYLFSDIFTAKWSEKDNQMIQTLNISKLF